MRQAAFILAATLALGACGKSNNQADALDRAAGQADPAAAEVMRNEADQIRDGASDANLSDANAPAQDAMSAAGAAAAGNDAAPANGFVGEKMLTRGGPAAKPAQAAVPVDNRAATPHRAGEPVPGSERAGGR